MGHTLNELSGFLSFSILLHGFEQLCYIKYLTPEKVHYISSQTFDSSGYFIYENQNLSSETKVISTYYQGFTVKNSAKKKKLSLHHQDLLSVIWWAQQAAKAKKS